MSGNSLINPFTVEDIRTLEEECEKINAELKKLGEEARDALNDSSDESDDDTYSDDDVHRDEYRDEVVEPINEIMEKYGYEPWNASDIESVGLPDGDWEYGQTLTYRKVVKGKAVYANVYVRVDGFGSTTYGVSIRLAKIYSYNDCDDYDYDDYDEDYDDQDRPVIYFARRLTENGWEDCTEELEEEL